MPFEKKIKINNGFDDNPAYVIALQKKEKDIKYIGIVPYPDGSITVKDNSETLEILLIPVFLKKHPKKDKCRVKAQANCDCKLTMINDLDWSLAVSEKPGIQATPTDPDHTNVDIGDPQ